MKSEGLYSLTFTLRQADHCNQGGLFKDKSQRTFASKTVFCTTIYRGYPEPVQRLFDSDLYKRYIAVGEANGKSSTFTLENNRLHTDCVGSVGCYQTPHRRS